MVIVLEAQAAVTPVGKPDGLPIPVAPVVAMVIVVISVLIHKVGDELAIAAVLAGVTIIVPVADTVPQPPVNGMM